MNAESQGAVSPAGATEKTDHTTKVCNLIMTIVIAICVTVVLGITLTRVLGDGGVSAKEQSNNTETADQKSNVSPNWLDELREEVDRLEKIVDRLKPEGDSGQPKKVDAK